MTDVTSKAISSESRNDALTISAAARATRLDRRAIRRHLDNGRFPGAFRGSGSSGTDTGSWRIPVEDLSAAGLLSDDRLGRTAARPVPSLDASSEISRLQAELAETVRRAQAAEATLLQRNQVIEAQRHALAALGRGADHHDRLQLPSAENDHRGLSRHELNGQWASEWSDRSDRPDGGGHETPDDPGQPDVPLFASSWASVPPWDQTPIVGPPPQQRWWQRLASGARLRTAASAAADLGDQR